MHISPPSIPSGDFRFGYKVDNDGHNMISLKQLLKKHIMNEDSSKFMGPGYYEI
jgi:hypothetical protein